MLAVRVPHLREVVGAGCRRLLTRPGPLQAATAAPALGLPWLMASRPERTVAALLADPAAQLLFAAIGILFLAALGRESIVRRVDAWAHPGAADQQQALAPLAPAVAAETGGRLHPAGDRPGPGRPLGVATDPLGCPRHRRVGALATATAALAQAQAGSIKRVSRVVTRAAKRGCGSHAVLVAAVDPDTHARTLHVLDAAPLPHTSAIVHMLESAAGILRVHPTDASSLYRLLPPDEATWVVEVAADAIVPVPGPGGELLGVLAVGRRFDDRLVRPADLHFLEALDATALGRLRMMDPAGGSAAEAPPAEECPVCRCVVQAGEAPGRGCGSAYVESEVPKLLAGKFRLTRRLGTGGMGAAYLARDLRLQRNVAVKILTRLSALGRLKSEARAMAELAHPAVAQIHAIKSLARPLVPRRRVPGRRDARGPARTWTGSRDEAISIAGALADALADLHGAGYVHGDVKPSNIGFTAAGSPKLLDFGPTTSGRWPWSSTRWSRGTILSPAPRPTSVK